MNSQFIYFIVTPDVHSSKYEYQMKTKTQHKIFLNFWPNLKFFKIFHFPPQILLKFKIPLIFWQHAGT
jgi:hypothetical protein